MKKDTNISNKEPQSQTQELEAQLQDTQERLDLMKERQALENTGLFRQALLSSLSSISSALEESVNQLNSISQQLYDMNRLKTGEEPEEEENEDQKEEESPEPEDNDEAQEDFPRKKK